MKKIKAYFFKRYRHTSPSIFKLNYFKSFLSNIEVPRVKNILLKNQKDNHYLRRINEDCLKKNNEIEAIFYWSEHFQLMQ